MSIDCIFCKIANGQIPAPLLHQDEHAVAFTDINPQAPTHALVVPRRHVRDLVELADAAPAGGVDLGAHLLRTAAAVARSLGLADDGFRVVVNTGAHGGQTVLHLHLHVLGGRHLGWPPG